MVDLHCHILSGFDDGAKSVQESLTMAETAIADGITHVVATPHSSNEYRFDFAAVQQACRELQVAVGDRLKLATGCDFHLSPENLAALKKNAAPFCIHQKDYLLVEFNEFAIPPAMDETLYQIQLAGLRPIITHPQQNALTWIARGLVHFVASDAHNLTARPHKLRAAYDVVRSEFGQQMAEALFVENPLAAFEGQPLPHVPEIVEQQGK